MTSYPDFGTIMARLLSHRGVDADWLSTESGVPAPELRGVLAGAAPLPAHLEALAPALGLHVADLYVIAALPVPQALTPREAAPGPRLADLVQYALALPPDQRDRVHRLVDQLRQESPEGPLDPPRMADQREGGFGAALVNLLFGNRNLRSLRAAAKLLFLLTNGHLCLAETTIAALARGGVPLTPDMVAGFARALGLSEGDLAAVVGVGLPEPRWPDDPLAAEMAGLLWNCRLLASAQVDQVYAATRSMLVPMPAGASDEDWNSVYYQDGTWWGAPKQ
ncbi:hypothetical protein [Kitasatospora sp. NPDC059160]|uniref:hypothetical protein n=1 Tax=Kitasatospora sp. NPDC059160 TaxID=3346748 RepID=UPI0036BBECEB